MIAETDIFRKICLLRRLIYFLLHNPKGLTRVQDLRGRGNRSLLIGGFLLRLSDFSVVGNIIHHGSISY